MPTFALHTNNIPIGVGALLARRTQSTVPMVARVTDKPRKSNNRMKLLITMLTVMLINGCALAPGSHIHDHNNRWYVGQTERSEREWEKNVEVYQVTPELLERLSAPKPLPKTVSNELKKAVTQYDYKIGVGDVLNVTVWDHPELTIPQGSERGAAESGNWVHSDGAIFYPYVGKIKVAGLNVGDVREKLTTALSSYIQKPQVDVTIAAFRSKRTYITGAVEKPGAIPITNIPLTLLDAVNKAGGLAELADWNSVILSRGGEEIRYSFRKLYQEGDLTQNTILQDGDVVHVNRNDEQKIFVLGEVSKPQPVPIKRSLVTLAEALSVAGGLNELQANASGVFVLRQESSGKRNGATVYQLDASNATALVLADQFELQPRDIVYVTAAPISRWNRIVRQLLPTIQAVRSVGDIKSDNFDF